jgi:SAM-dependent methyltransferase
MNSWASGYVSDVEYTHKFYRELSPLYLHYVCLTQGIRPPPLGAGASYCELGCGQGVGTAIVAASNPQMQVVGIDFTPSHVANARRLAAEGGLTNVQFLDHSFEHALRQPPGTFPEFDYITLHGVYSWISVENRRLIVEFIDRHLKPGGIAYLSYNCLPGWTGVAPLQRLIREHANRHPDRSDVQGKAALDFIRTLADAKAHYFAQNPAAAALLKELAGSDGSYIAHEYLNQQWCPLYHADVAKEMEGARLTFVGSASLVENNDRLGFPEGVVPLLRESRDAVWRETLRDYARNQKFRKDIFMRGASPMKPVEHSDALSKMRVALLLNRDAATHVFPTPTGKIMGNAEVCVPVLDALGERPHTIGELAALPALKGKPGSSAVEAVNLLVHFSQVHPLLPDWRSSDSDPPKNLNKAIARRIRIGDILGDIAAPAAGSGVPASYVDLIAMLALAEGMAPDPREVAKFGWSVMYRAGQRMLKDKVSLQSPEENIAELESQLARLYARQLPIWKTLGVV